MKTKRIIANEIIKFFRMFRISSIIGFITIVAMYFGFYKSYKCFNLGLTDIEIELLYYDGNRFLKDGIDSLSTPPFKMMPTHTMYHYGSSFNKRINNYYYPLTDVKTTYRLKMRIQNCCDRWLKDRLIHSALFGLAAFLIIPILFTFIRLIYRALITSKQWIDKHKTPQP